MERTLSSGRIGWFQRLTAVRGVIRRYPPASFDASSGIQDGAVFAAVHTGLFGFVDFTLTGRIADMVKALRTVNTPVDSFTGAGLPMAEIGTGGSS